MYKMNCTYVYLVRIKTYLSISISIKEKSAVKEEIVLERPKEKGKGKLEG